MEHAAILLDGCPLADHLPMEALAAAFERPAPPRHGALLLDGRALAAALRRTEVQGCAYVYANGCVVAAGMDPQDTLDLLLLLSRHAPHSDFERMMALRELRTVPGDALAARARALCASMTDRKSIV